MEPLLKTIMNWGSSFEQEYLKLSWKHLGEEETPGLSIEKSDALTEIPWMHQIEVNKPQEALFPIVSPEFLLDHQSGYGSH